MTAREELADELAEWEARQEEREEANPDPTPEYSDRCAICHGDSCDC